MILSKPEIFEAWKANGLVVSQMVDLNGDRFDTIDESYFDGFGKFYLSHAIHPDRAKWNCLTITEDALAHIRRSNAKSSSKNPVLVGCFQYCPEPGSSAPVSEGFLFHALVCFIDSVNGLLEVKFWEPQQYRILTLTEYEKSSQLNPVRFY
jgi:hypothetical protein